MGVTLTGQTASLRWVYHTAATLGAWTVTTRDGRRSLQATIVGTDTFRIAQRPLVFVAPHAHGAWRWPIASLQMVGASLTATLGPVE